MQFQIQGEAGEKITVIKNKVVAKVFRTLLAICQKLRESSFNTNSSFDKYFNLIKF